MGSWFPLLDDLFRAHQVVIYDFSGLGGETGLFIYTFLQLNSRARTSSSRSFAVDEAFCLFFDKLMPVKKRFLWMGLKLKLT